MARQTSETLLISAAINSEDPHFMKRWGIIPKHFHGFREEAEWLAEFGKDYGRTPSWVEFGTKFDDFPANHEQEDGKYPADEVSDQHNTRVVTRTMLKASMQIKAGNVGDGIEMLRLMDIHKAVDAPRNVLSDRSLLTDYEKPQDRIEVPYKTLQYRTLGIGPGELWYIGARPSQGKSIHTSVLAAHAALQGRRVIIYSMEMTREAMAMRLHTIFAQLLGVPISLYDLRRRRLDPRTYKKVLDAIEEKVTGVIDIHTPAEGMCRPSVVASRAGDYDVNIIDYIGLMRPDGHGRAVDDWRVIAAMSNEMKEIALSRNTRILAASQINRDGDHSFRPPKLSQLSQSDALAQDGDVVLTLTKFRRVDGVSHFSIEKNREGQAQTQFYTKFDVEHGDFEEVDINEAKEIAAENDQDDD